VENQVAGAHHMGPSPKQWFKKSDRIGSEERQNTAIRVSIHLTMVL